MRLGVRFVPPLLAASAALVAAWPIVGSYFYADDFAHLFEIASFGPWDFLTAPYAGHMYLVRNAVFYASFRFFDMEPAGYFALALATHVVNALLLFALVRRLTGDALLACLGGVLFGASPAVTGTLGWYSVFGHALATAATISALLVVAPRPGETRALAPRAACGAGATMLVASQCFGTGAAVALVFPALVLLLRPATLRRPASLAALGALPLLVLGVWWGMNSLPTRLNPWGVQAASGMAALATDYRHVGLMAAHLIAIGVDGLVLGPAFPRVSYGGAASIAAVGVFGAALAAAFLRGTSPARRALLAFLLAATTCYLAIAAGRAALFSAYVHDRLLHAFVDATRYQYLAQALLAVVVSLVVAELAFPSTRARRVLLGVWILGVLGTAALVRPSIAVYASDRPRVAAALERLEEAVRSRPPGASVCLPIQVVPLLPGFPGSLGLYVLFHRTNELEGRRVYFVSADPDLLALRLVPGRLRGLLLPPDACPPRGDDEAPRP